MVIFYCLLMAVLCRSDMNTIVDIKFSAHGAFLEPPSSGTLKAKIFESQLILKSLGTGIQNVLNKIVKID